MTKKPTVTTISSGYYSTTALNNNFTNIRDEFDNTLSLDGSTPNAMQADLDLNNNDILNVKELSADEITLDGTSIAAQADAAASSASDAADSADAAEAAAATVPSPSADAFLRGSGDGTTFENLTAAQVRTAINVDRNVQTKSANFTVATSERADVYLVTDTATASLPAAATADDGYWFTLIADGADATIDPDSSEQINGSATLTVSDGTSVDVFCDGTGWLTRKCSTKGVVTPQHFGAVGDGVADDTAALAAAVTSGLPLDLGSGIYRHTTPLSATVAKVDWNGDGAVIFYDGAHAREAVVITCGMGQDHKVYGIEFDANQKANVAAKFIAATVSEPIGQWPNFYGTQIIARNAYRADTTFPDGDGFMVNGGFNHAEVENIRVYDCYMAEGAEITLSQGIFGITFSSNGSRRCRNVRLENYHVENVWSEDETYKNDQDGVRVFQETAERTSSCYLLHGTIKNVSNRAIKLHSGVNAVVDGLYRELDENVIPQSGEFPTQPDIDSQQCPATITNCRFHYDGAWHPTLIQNYTEREELFRYGGTVVDGITGRFVNVTGSSIVAVKMTGESGISETKHIGAVSNIAIDGPVESFLSVLIRGAAGTNSVSLVNAVAEVTDQAVNAKSENARLRVTAANLHNTNSSAPVPLGAGFDAGDRELTVLGHYGFTTSGASLALGGDDKSLSLNSLTALTSFTGPSPDDSRIGSSLVGYAIPSDAGVSDNDTIILLAPTADTQSHISGTVQLYRGVAASAGGGTLSLLLMKDASTGDAAGHCRFDGLVDQSASLITCSFDGVQRFGVRLSGGTTSKSLARAFFNGNYLGSADMRLVPASSVTGIDDFVQRSAFEQVSQFLQPIRLPSYTVATLPSASTFTSCQIWVSDETDGAQPAYSDGTNWRRYSDGAIVS